MMKRSILMIVLAAGACERPPQSETAAPTAASVNEALASPAATISKPPAVVPRPKDQAELDRMILAGFTPHADHLHAPGVKSCPLAQGNEAVM